MNTRNKLPRSHVRLAGTLLGSTLALAAVAAWDIVCPGLAAAQDIQRTGPLAGAPAVEHLRLYREGRFEVALSTSFTLLDEYQRTILPGVRLNYNLTDWFGVGVWGAFGAISSPTGLTNQIDTVAPRGPRTAINLPYDPTKPTARGSFADQTAKIQFIANPQITLVPFRGKLSLFKSIFVDTDAYLHVGAAFVGLAERPNCGGGGTEKKCGDPTSFKTESRIAIAPSFGLGLTFHASSLVSLGLEYRAIPFAWNRAGFDTRGKGSSGDAPDTKLTADDRTFKFNQMFSVFLGFTLGERKISPGTDPKALEEAAAADAKASSGK
jgi:hypothetical protein